MPVITQKRAGKHRVIERATGRIAKTKSGTAIDGGGFKSKNAATRQVQAVNIALSKR